MVNTATRDRDRPRRRVGVIDIGSNTVLALVMEEGGAVVLDKSLITRIGEGLVSGGRLGDAPRRRTLEGVRDLAKLGREAGAVRLVAVGTEALRRARDGARFMEEVRSDAGLDDARILSGDEEASLAIECWRRSTGGQHPIAVLDVGGGSTELAWTSGVGAPKGLSLPLGSVRLTEAIVRSDPLEPRELEALRAAARREIPAAPFSEAAAALGEDGEVIAVAGTATTLAALDLALEPYDAERIEAYRLSRDRAERWIERLAALPLAERRRLRGMEAGRADVIVAGLVILAECLGALRCRAFRASGRGIRYGVALRLLEEAPAVW